MFPSATSEDAAQAAAAAAEAFPAWAATPAPVRGAVLFRAAALLDERAEEVARTLTREEGKTLTEARGEVLRARDILRYYAGEGWRAGGDVLPANSAGSLLFSRREPLGVVAAITPWNFPIAIPAWKIAPALAYGDTVVFKPASATPLTALALVECLQDAGLPAGVLNMVTGAGSVVGAALAGDPLVRGLTFTGSRDTGPGIYERATRQFTRVQLEMGGKNPTVVLDDADVDLAVRIVVAGGFGLTGQACTATSRRHRRGRHRRPLRRGLGGGRRGTHRRRRSARGRADGAGRERAAARRRSRLHRHRPAGGRHPARRRGPRHGDGHFVRPTVLDDVDVRSRLAQEEMFGPCGCDPGPRPGRRAVQGQRRGLWPLGRRGDQRSAPRAHLRRPHRGGRRQGQRATSGVALQAPFGGFKQSSANTFKEQGPRHSTSTPAPRPLHQLRLNSRACGGAVRATCRITPGPVVLCPMAGVSVRAWRPSYAANSLCHGPGCVSACTSTSSACSTAATACR